MTVKTQGSATVKITATVELQLTASWQGSETVENLARSAGGQAVSELESLLRKGNARIVGTPNITTVWFNSQNKHIDDFKVT